MRSRHSGYLIRLGLLFAVYFLTARIGLSLDAVSGFATLVWPPTGIALAAMLSLGYRYWPGVAFAAFLVNIVTGAAPLVALGIALGNTLEALGGAYLLNRFTKIYASLDRVEDVLGLIFFAAIGSTLISATIGVSSLLIGGVIHSSSYVETWLAWWVGDMLGALVIAPLLLVWNARFRYPIDSKRLVRAIVPVVLLVCSSVLVFYGLPWLNVKPFHFAYIIFPFLAWIALSFNQRGSVVATFIVSFIAVWGTVVTHDSAKTTTLAQNLLLLQSFIGVTAATFLTMAAVVSEREEIQRKEQKLIQKTMLLTKQRARLEALNRAKDDFIAIASHQLRTPATGVKQYLGMLLENHAGKLSSKQSAFIETAYESNERQLRIINDLLRVARLDAGKIHLKKADCDITKLTSAIVRQQSEEFKKRNQTLYFHPAKKRIRADVDAEFLSMAIENIIDNAGKYSSEREEVSVKLTQTHDHVRLYISDKGVGIAKKDQKKLFQKFSRVENAHPNFVNGSGLGLYWAKKIVELHDGTIDLASQLNEGSTFIIGLPVKSPVIMRSQKKA